MRFLVDAAELPLGNVAVIAAQLLLGLELHAVVGELGLAALAVLAGAVFALVDGALRAAPDILAHAAVDLVLRLVALGHRVLIVDQVLRIAPSFVPDLPEPTGFEPKRKSVNGKTAGRETPRGPNGPRDGRFLGAIGRGCQTPAVERASRRGRSRQAPPPRPADGVRPEVKTARAGRALGARRRRPEQIDHPAGDGGGRVDVIAPARAPASRSRRSSSGIMRAGQHDGVGARAVGLDEARRNLGGDRRRRRRARPLSSASANSASRGEPTSVTAQSLPCSRMSARVYSRFTVASVPSTDTSLLFELEHAGLIAGTVPTNGTLNFFAQLRRAPGPRRCCRRPPRGPAGAPRSARPSPSTHAGDQHRLVLAAVGEERVVGGIDETRVGPRLRRSRGTR